MDRRDISKALFATAAGSAVVARQANAQSCTAPCYAQTPAEMTVGVTPVNSSIPSHLACGLCFVERYGNNTAPGITDMTAAAQNAVYVALQANCGIAAATMCLLTAAVNIDRLVDGAAFDNYFYVVGDNGGGFQVNSAIAMFSSTIAFSSAPVSQLLFFDGVTFIGNSGASYVLNDGRFLRTRFNKCNFDKILGCKSSIYVQSIQFTHCNMRRGVGTFWTSTGVTYDFKWIGNITEAWTGSVLNLAKVIGGAIMGSLLEGVSIAAITYNGAAGFTISGNYFEGNALDIDGTGVTQASGVSITGNFFDRSSNPTVYGIKWGNGSPVNCFSTGNHCNGRLHTFPVAGMDVCIKDSATVALYDNEPTPSFPTLVSFNDGALGGAYGGVVKGYGVTGAGGFLGLGVLNNGTYTEAITINQAAQVFINKSTPAAASGQLGIGTTTATTATAGGETLPANPALFLEINISGTFYKIPLYNT